MTNRTFREGLLEVLYPTPSARLMPMFQESLRRAAIEDGCCEDCIAKFPDPAKLAPPMEGERERLDKSLAEVEEQIQKLTDTPGGDLILPNLLEIKEVLVLRRDAIS